MITYKFSIGKKGLLTCYKSDNTLSKYTGKKAFNKLDHIMDFSYHSFDAFVNDINPNKKCYSMVFVSNNHVVTFEDISKFQRSADFPIEEILKAIIAIAKENNLKAEQLQQTIMEQYSIDVRKTKAALLVAFSALLVMINNHPKSAVKNKSNVVNKDNINENVEEITVSENEYISVIDSKEFPDELILDYKYGVISKENDCSLEYSDNVATFAANNEWDGTVLNSNIGVIENGPSGEYETYYDADVISEAGMDNCVKYMRELGYDEETYPYYIREDGVRMFGDYVMVAANTNVLPKGSVLETTLGTAMVVDHCENSEKQAHLVDIAVNWTKKKELKK